jgi:hypothetical protein
VAAWKQIDSVPQPGGWRGWILRNDYRLIFCLLLGLLQAGAFSELDRTSAP